MAASTCATEIKFIQMLLEEVMPNEEIRPATLFEDNTGAIYLMENQAVGSRTKHIDVRMHHIREMMEGPNPRLRVMFTRSESNFADILTKNVSERTFTQLVPALKSGDIARVMFETVDREDVKKVDRTTDGPCGTSVPEPGGWHVSTVERHTKELSLSDPGTSPCSSDDLSWTIVKSRRKVSKNNSARAKSKWKESMNNCSGCDHDHD